MASASKGLLRYRQQVQAYVGYWLAQKWERIGVWHTFL